jgi:flagellar hook-associated protein 3 FlgL
MNVTELPSRVAGIDMAQAATDLKWLEFAHQASLQTAAKIIPPTLLDFLR